MMYGYQKTYGALLEEAELETLEARREKQFLKFAKKASENPNYSEYFPKNNCTVNTRRHKLFKEEFARTDRLYYSPVYAMRRALNETPYSDRFNNPNYIDLSFMFNNPFD